MSNNSDLTKLREKVHTVLVEVEVALDSGTYPDWAEVKDRLLESIELVRKLERDQLWQRLSKK